MAVTTPELHIRALAQEDVTKGGVAAVRRAAQQGVQAVDLAGEQHGVAVEGDKGVLDADKGLEVGGLGDADGRTVEVLTPDDIVGILHLHKTGIVGVHRHKRLALFVDEGDLVLVKVPVDAVLAASQIDVGDAVDLLATEHADELALVGHHGTVEDACHPFHRVAVDDGVLVIPPHRGGNIGRLFLPGDVGQCIAEHFYVAHKINSCNRRLFVFLLLYSPGSCTETGRSSR